MCGRFTLSTNADEIACDLEVELFEAEQKNMPSFNIAPTQLAAILVDGGQRRLKMMRWGLVPSWAKDETIGSRMINARSETLAEKPSFRNLIDKRRCLVVVNGYYEWQKTGGGKQPHYIHSADNGLLLFAGLWDVRRPPGREPLHSFTIITTNAAPSLTDLHHRMPVVLDRGHASVWSDIDQCSKADAVTLLKPNDRGLAVHPVSTFVNSVRNNSPQCIEKIFSTDTLF